MQYEAYGRPGQPVVLLLHGGGLSSWSLAPVARRLSAGYYVVTPVIEGHGASRDVPFTTIEASARRLLAFIDDRLGGRVFALGGLSLGGQIALEALSQRADLARYAMLDGTLATPIPGVAALAAPTYRLCYGLIQQAWFARAQAKALFVPPAMFEQYFADSAAMTRQTLVNITIANSQYKIKNTIADILASTLIVVGGRERDVMLRSARAMAGAIPHSSLRVLKGMGHGELAMTQPARYGDMLADFIENRG